MNIDRNGKEFGEFCETVGIAPHDADMIVSEALFGALNEARTKARNAIGWLVILESVVKDLESKVEALEAKATKKPGRPKKEKK